MSLSVTFGLITFPKQFIGQGRDRGVVHRSSRCVMAFLAASLLAAIPILGQAVVAGAAAAGTLFAITGPNQSVLSRVDPVTGIITPFEDLAGADQGQLVTITGDPASHRIFAVRSSVTFDPNGISVKNEALSINSQTGAFSVSPPLNLPVGQIAFDPSAK